ncbi:MAG: serine/threonine-protein kinase [Polyangiaceae bacterium]
MATDQIGKYRVIGKLGQGGMARVLLTVVAGPHNFNKLLVVKELREDLAQDPEFLSMFLDEARLAARLNHPNVVQTYEVGQEGDRFFIAMEYLEGQPLHAVLRRIGRNNVPLDLQVRVLADALAGLDYAHHLTDFDGSPLNVVHRDVSPQNIFVTYDGQVKVVDFGIAKASGASSSTREGVFKGKLAYVAPEQARGAAIDGRADLFSVGVMLWEAIAGRRLANVEGEAGILARRMAGQDPKIAEVVPDAPPELAEICNKAMSLEPSERYTTAREFQEALEDYLERSPYRVGPKEVGSIVANAFKEERQKIRTLVDEQIRRQKEANEAEPVSIVDMAATMGMRDPTPSVVTHTGALMGARNDSSLGSLGVSQVSQPGVVLPAPQSRTWLYALAAIVLVGAAVGAFIIVSGKTTRATAQPTEVPSAPTAKSEPTVVAPEIAGPRVALRIEFPKGVKVKLDGAAINESPFTASVPRDAGLHKIEMVDESGGSDVRMVTFDKDVTVNLAIPDLAPSASASGAPIVTRPWHTTPATPATTSTPSTPPTVVIEPPHVPTNKPTGDGIDESDPYHRKK